MTAIQGEHISLQRGYFKLDDVNITLPAGQLTAIVGPNGSGKSTLFADHDPVKPSRIRVRFPSSASPCRNTSGVILPRRLQCYRK